MRSVRWAVGGAGTLALAALCLINPWLLLAVIGIPVFVWMLRSNSFSRTRIIIAAVCVSGAVLVGLALLLFTASGSGPTGVAPVPATYEARVRYASVDETWEIEERIAIEHSSLDIRLIRRESVRSGWDFVAAMDGQFLFSRSPRQATELDWWPPSQVHVIAIEVPVERTLEFDEGSRMTLIAPKNMVAATFPPGSDPVDRLQDSEQQTVIDLSNLEDDNKVRIKVLSPLVRNPLGVRLVEVASNGVAWGIVLALLGIVAAMIRKEVEETISAATGRLMKRPRRPIPRKS